MNDVKGWWSRRKATKRANRIAANKRDIESGRIQKAHPGPDGKQWYTENWYSFFVIDDDGKRTEVDREVDEIR